MMKKTEKTFSSKTTQGLLVGGIGLVLASSFWMDAGRGTLGEPGAPGAMAITADTWLSHAWQQNAQERRNHEFGFRNDWVRAKNTLYTLANFGRFHSAYGRGVLQGRNGVVFEKGYILNEFDWTQGTGLPQQEARSGIEAVKRLQEELSRYDIALVMSLFPNKVDQMEKVWPWLWRHQKKHHPKRVDRYAIWEAAAREAGVPIVNMMPWFKANGEGGHWFSKTGTHWTLAAAAAGVPLFSERVAEVTGQSLEVPPIARWQSDDRALHGERDIWSLLNLQEWLENRACAGSRYDFPIYASRMSPIPMTLYGDSYNGNWQRALQGAGVIDDATSFHTHNRPLTDEELFGVVMRGGVFSLGYSSGNFSGTRIRDDAQRLVDRLVSGKPFLRSGWWVEGSEAWTGSRAEMAFLRPKDARSDAVVRFRHVAHMPTVSAATVSVNGKVVRHLSSADLAAPAEWEFQLPARLLKTGVNSVQIAVTGAAMPVSFNINSDSRNLGLRVTLPVVENLQPLALNQSYQSVSGNTVGGRILRTGWSGAESWGTWSDGRKARIQLEVPDGATELVLAVQPFVTAGHEKQRVLVKTANGMVIQKVTLTEATAIHVPLDDRVIESIDGLPLADITLELPNAASPVSLSVNRDTRLLGIGLREWKVVSKP